MIKRLLILLLLIAPAFGDVENFNDGAGGWTVVDTQTGTISIDSSTKVSWTDIESDEPEYVYKDFGADHFSGASDQDYKFQMQFSNMSNQGGCCHWLMANMVGHRGAISGASEDYIAIDSFDESGTYQIRLIICINGSVTAIPYNSGALSTLYYIHVTYTASTGVYSATISDSGYDDDIHATLTRTDSEKNNWRYAYCCCNTDIDNNLRTEDGITQNMDLGESYASMPVIVNNHRRMR